MTEKIYKKLRNSVTFSAKGADIEGFLSYCIKNNIEITDPQKNNYEMKAKIRPKNYLILKKSAKKFGIKLRIKEKTGLYFYILKNIEKSGFIIGIIFTVFFCILMNRFIWIIEVSGNNKISEEKIIASAEKMGLLTGTPAKSHAVQDIEWFILNENEELSDVQINIQGSRANITVNERLDEPIMTPDDDLPVNLIAAKYGVIRKTEVFDGQSLVKPGDAVMKGDLLVSAVYEDRHNKLTLKHARANIIAETDHSVKIEFPMNRIIYEKDKIIKEIYKFDFFGYNFKIGKEDNENLNNYEEIYSDFVFFGIKLPVNLCIRRYFDVKASAITYETDDAAEGALRLLEQYEEKEMKNMEILSRKINEYTKNDKYIVEAEYIVLMNIAVEQIIESDIPWENTDDMS